MQVNGGRVAQIARDDRSRTATITDHTRDDGDVTDELTYNRLGQLIQRATSTDSDAQTTQWEYDAAGGC